MTFTLSLILLILLTIHGHATTPPPDEATFKKIVMQMLAEGYEFRVPPHSLFCDDWKSQPVDQILQHKTMAFEYAEQYEQEVKRLHSLTYEKIAQLQRKGCVIWAKRNKEEKGHGHLENFSLKRISEKEESGEKEPAQWDFTLAPEIQGTSFSQKITGTAFPWKILDGPASPFPLIPNTLKIAANWHNNSTFWFQIQETIHQQKRKIFEGKNQVTRLNYRYFHLDLSLMMIQDNLTLGGGPSLLQETLFYARDAATVSSTNISILSLNVILRWWWKIKSQNLLELWTRYHFGLKFHGTNHLQLKSPIYHQLVLEPRYFLKKVFLGPTLRMSYLGMELKNVSSGPQKIRKTTWNLGLSAGVNF